MEARGLFGANSWPMRTIETHGTRPERIRLALYIPFATLPRLHLNLRYIALAAFFSPVLAVAAESQCYGTVSNGRIERSVKLPLSGANFSATKTSAGRKFLEKQKPMRTCCFTIITDLVGRIAVFDETST